MKHLFYLLFISFLFLQGCLEYEDDPICSEYQYISLVELRSSVEIQDAKEIKKSGKIYIYENFLFINEPNRGIHIIDNSDQKNPIKKAFIKIPGNIDIAIKEHSLYADSFMDLVILDISDMENIKIIKRIENLLPFHYKLDYFITDECNFDTNNGIVIKVEK